LDLPLNHAELPAQSIDARSLLLERVNLALLRCDLGVLLLQSVEQQRG
jgi:hypothetical protein